jgi:hypothetical protein
MGVKVSLAEVMTILNLGVANTIVSGGGSSSADYLPKRFQATTLAKQVFYIFVQ